MDRLWYYAAFVRFLHIGGSYQQHTDGEDLILDSTILHALVSPRGPQLTFPRLRCLSIESLPNCMHEYANAFLVPAVRKLIYGSISMTDRACLPLMAHLRRSCARVEELQLETWSMLNEVLDGVFQFIGSFSNLRKLVYKHTGFHMYSAILRLLADLPGLEDLHFSLTPHDWDMRIAGPQFGKRHIGRFRSLQKLIVKSWSSKLAHIEPLLSMVQSAPLKRLIITFPSRSDGRPPNRHYVFPTLRVLGLGAKSYGIIGPILTHMSLPGLEELLAASVESARSFRNIISSVSTTCSPTSLKRLDLRHSSDYNTENMSMPLDPMIRPLLAFRRIEDLRLRSSYAFEMSDKTVEEFALSWPNLKRIYISWKAHTSASTVTIKGLASLASHCPCLESIVLPVNVIPVPTIEEVGYKDTSRNHNIKVLDFDASSVPAECIKELASVLRQLFPVLQKITSSEKITLELAGR
ncbi:hypothetical protein OE88DRAFT_631732 [Heliocybe sulcata]|uniref:F-box domain-containing protein n=1 Tax=Heliocybe sulcata TaxID=5364 RepID=A0A5C3NEY6_9AGAM|nr:hypothetical protein OE88DRAFT_631732 [Heliocybe sulcata]